MKTNCRDCLRVYNREYARNTRRQRCSRGHQYTDVGVGKDGRGLRRCYVCRPAAKPREPKPPRTHCKRGHPYEKSAVLWGGRRYCRTCHNASVQQWRLDHPEKVRESARAATARFMAKKRALRQEVNENRAE